MRSYRYGFQGQEMDDEVKGEGNSVNYKYRMHDPRVGRFFAIDPLTTKYPNLTPYQFCSNSPIYYIEIEGLEGTLYTYKVWYNEQGRQSKIVSAKVVEGLKYDVVKSVVLPYNSPNGKTHHLEYAYRNEDGTKGYTAEYSLDAKPTVAQLNKLFKEFDNNIKPKEAKKEESILPVWLNEGHLAGGADPTGEGTMQGTKGMREGAQILDDAGSVLNYTRIGAPLGLAFGIMADFMQSGADISENKPNAARNLTVRLGNTGLNLFIGTQVDKLPLKDFNKEAIKGAVNQGSGIVETEVTK